VIGIIFALYHVDPQAEVMHALWGAVGTIAQGSNFLFSPSVSFLEWLSGALPFVIGILTTFLGACWYGGWWGGIFFVIGWAVGYSFITLAPRVPESILLVLILGLDWPRFLRRLARELEEL
jgi:hypothetical protein